MDENTPPEMDPVVALIILLVAVLITVVPFWKIFSKAGYSGWLSLLMLIPLVNIIMLFFLAFARWPILVVRDNPRLTDTNLPPSSTL